jgi:uncharacterized caspase-like protein
MWLCSSSTSIIEDRDLSAHLNILTIRGPGDVRILFVSGHGDRGGARNEYYFCSYQHNPDEPILEKYDVRWNIILDSLTAIPGKAVLMVDTCLAAAVSGDARAKGLRAVNFDNVLADLKGISGVVVFAASTGQESSFERPDWGHGAFTKAVLDALSGGMSGKDGIIRTSELDTWVKERVSMMTDNQQHALVYYLPPSELLPFPIFSVEPARH